MNKSFCAFIYFYFFMRLKRSNRYKTLFHPKQQCIKQFANILFILFFIFRSSRSGVPNRRSADRYRSAGHLVPGRTERTCLNSVLFRNTKDVLFWKITGFSVTSVCVTLDTRQATLSPVTWPIPLKNKTPELAKWVKKLLEIKWQRP